MRNKIIDIKIERTFGELLGDGMKLVFRHLKEMGILLLFYVMPFIAIALFVIIINGSLSSILSPAALMTDSGLMSLMAIYLVLGIGLGIGVLVMNLIVYSMIITYFEYDGMVSADKISANVKKYFGNYLVSVLGQIGVGVLMIGFVSVFALISPVLFGVLYVVMIFVAAWVFNVIQFLGVVRIEEQLPIYDGLRRCFYLLKDHWWETFALIIITSLLGSVLMYAIMIVFLMLVAAFAGVYSDQAVQSSTLLYILSGIFMILYILVMSASNMYLAGVRILKYYDLVEKKEANNLLNAIDRIGDRSNDIFENEGEF